jgi:AcrR family transcriptional regulator
MVAPWVLRGHERARADHRPARVRPVVSAAREIPKSMMRRPGRAAGKTPEVTDIYSQRVGGQDHWQPECGEAWFAMLFGRGSGRPLRGFRNRLSQSAHSVSECGITYSDVVPKLWNETIEAHRRDVQAAILDATAALVAEHGLLSVTMSQIAEETGIGRATLYKYFSDVEAILVAWHLRQVSGHLEQLVRLRDRAGEPRERLEAVLEAYALIHYQHHGTVLAALLHQGEHLAHANQQLNELIRGLLAEAATAGAIRDDVDPAELATYCLHAITAASELPSKAAVRRLVQVTLTGLRPASGPSQ